MPNKTNEWQIKLINAHRINKYQIKFVRTANDIMCYGKQDYKLHTIGLLYL